MAPRSWTCKSPSILLLAHPKGQGLFRKPRKPAQGPTGLPHPCYPPSAYRVLCVQGLGQERGHHKPGKSVSLTPWYRWADRGSERRDACPGPHHPSAVEWRFKARLAVDSRPLVPGCLATCPHWNPSPNPHHWHIRAKHASTASEGHPRPPTPRTQPRPTPSLSNTSSHQVSRWPLCSPHLSQPGQE